MKFAGVLLALLLSGSMSASAQGLSRALEVIPWHIRTEPGSVRPGGKVRVVFQAGLDLTEGGPWKMYALGSPLPSRAIKVAFSSMSEGVALCSDVEQWGAQSGFDPWFEKTVEYFEKYALLWADLSVDVDAEEGVHEVRGEISFMICNERMCLPPASMTFEAGFAVSLEAPEMLPQTPPAFRSELFDVSPPQRRRDPR